MDDHDVGVHPSARLWKREEKEGREKRGPYSQGQRPLEEDLFFLFPLLPSFFPAVFLLSIVESSIHSFDRIMDWLDAPVGRLSHDDDDDLFLLVRKDGRTEKER